MDTIQNTEEKKNNKIVDRIIATMSAIFMPNLPVITAAGVLKALLLLAGNTGLLSTGSDTYYVFSFVSAAGFYFIPIFLAASAAKHFGGNPYLAMFLAAVLFHPDLTSLIDSGRELSFLGVQIDVRSYGSGVIPGICIGILEAYLEKFFKKVVPELLSFLGVPLLVTLVGAPLILIIIGPLSLKIGEGLGWAMEFIHLQIGWPAVAVLAAAFPFLVMFGSNLCLLPLSLAAIATYGFDAFTRPAGLCANMAIAGAAFAAFLRVKAKKDKSMALQASLVALMGVTEPALYGVLFPRKKPLIAAVIGSAIGGAFSGFFDVKAIAYASPCVITLPIFLGDTFIWAIFAIVVSFLAGFLVCMLMGFEDN